MKPIKLDPGAVIATIAFGVLLIALMAGLIHWRMTHHCMRSHVEHHTSNMLMCRTSRPFWCHTVPINSTVNVCDNWEKNQ